MPWPAVSPGRLLERIGDDAPRGMTVHDRTRLIGRRRRPKAKASESPVITASGDCSTRLFPTSFALSPCTGEGDGWGRTAAMHPSGPHPSPPPPAGEGAGASHAGRTPGALR